MSPGGRAEDGARYRDAAARTGGVFLSICERDWMFLENLGTTAFGLRRVFELSDDARPASIEVVVDGVAVPAMTPEGAVAWAYRPTLRFVEFSPFAVPRPGARIEISYVPACR